MVHIRGAGIILKGIPFGTAHLNTCVHVLARAIVLAGVLEYSVFIACLGHCDTTASIATTGIIRNTVVVAVVVNTESGIVT